MGAIRDRSTGEIYELEVECVIGRAPGCSLRVARPFVSGRHAKLFWDGGGWQLRDLVSRNGTFVDDQRLGPGSCRRLGPGSRIGVGVATSGWDLVDESPPGVLVNSLSEGHQVVVKDGILAIPSCDDPGAMVYRDADGRWVLEKANHSITPISSMQIFELGSGVWRFSCPPDPPQDRNATDSAPARLAQIQLHFLVPPRQEPPQLRLMNGRQTIEVVDCHRLLLTLARKRLADAAAGLSEAALGWTSEDELASEARRWGIALNTEICRIRRQFGRTDVLDPGSIVVRRPRLRHLRIGTGRIVISTI